MATILKKCMFKWCGCGPSDCQNKLVVGARSAATAQPGLLDETVQQASEEMSFRPGGAGGGAVDASTPESRGNDGQLHFNRRFLRSSVVKIGGQC